MNYSRRDFIRLGSLAIGTLTAFGGKGFSRTESIVDALYFQNAESFQKLIGSSFTFYREDSSSAAALTEVRIYKCESEDSGGECFSLVFEMFSDGFGQDTYQMFHPSIGSFELLSVPGTSTNGVPLLIAVINRI